MNGRKAKAIRKILKEHDAYKKEPDYQVIKHKKKVYHFNPISKKHDIDYVEKFQIVNKNRYTYRRAKKAYKRGELDV